MEVIKNAASSVTNTYNQVVKSFKQDGGVSGWFKARTAEAKQQYEHFVEAFKNFSAVNIKLGLHHLDRGNYYDARFRFRLVSWFNKSYPELNYYMGRAYFEDSKPAKAKIYIEKYLQSENEQHLVEAAYTLRVINKDTGIDSIPFPITAHFFDLLLPIYDALYLSTDDTPQQVVFNSVNKFVNNSAKPFGNVTLDLGCGTGMMGYLSRSAKISSEIIGVDISKRMFECAKLLKIDVLSVYNHVENKDASSYLSGVPADKKFDLVYAINSINFLGNLEELFTKVHQVLENNGIYVILFKTNKTTDNFTFDLNLEEFQHNKNYVEQLCGKLAFKIIEQAPINQVDGSESFYMIMQK